MAVKKKRKFGLAAIKSAFSAAPVHNDVDGVTHVLHDKTDFDTIETYKSIRTNLMFSMPRTEGGKVVIITSSTPGEGKTTTAINLAITFAQTGARVVLIDADLRKSRVHRYLKLERQDGMSNVLCGFIDLSKAIRRGVRENMDVLPAGEIPPNPTELIASSEFEKLLDALKEQYDYIFVDTPPMTVVTDAAVAMRQCTGTVMVVRQDVTTYDLLDVSMADIAKTGAKVLGIITIGTRDRNKKYGYYRRGSYKYKYKYRYRYDYTYSDPGNK